MCSPRRRGKKNGTETIFEEIIAENIPNLIKGNDHKSKKLSKAHAE